MDGARTRHHLNVLIGSSSSLHRFRIRRQAIRDVTEVSVLNNLSITRSQSLGCRSCALFEIGMRCVEGSKYGRRTRSSGHQQVVSALSRTCYQSPTSSTSTQRHVTLTPLRAGHSRSPPMLNPPKFGTHTGKTYIGSRFDLDNTPQSRYAIFSSRNVFYRTLP